MLLTLLLLIPLLGGVLAGIVGRRANAARWTALLACALQLTASVAIWRWSAAAHFRLDERAPWIPSLGVSYHLALDGLSLPLLLLTSFLGTIAVACSWREITHRVGAFHLALMSVLVGVTGVFLARDLLLFYLFWELMLVPMYFLIGLWGHARRVYASIKFFLFTFIGSTLMLAAILGLVYLHQRATGMLTFDLAELAGTPLSPTAANWLLLGFFLAFAVKLPVVPLHAWLADAHTEAPTGGSVLLAGLLLKTGAYGMLRVALPLFPEAAWHHALTGSILGVIGILYGAILAFAQTDFKRLIAYSSISHMGFVMLGASVPWLIPLQGAVVQMVCHGVSTGALFLLAGSIHERTGTRDLGRLGGLWQSAPRMGGFVVFFALAAMGLPGMGNFVGEFLVLLGVFGNFPKVAAVGAIGFVLSTVYAVRLIQESLHGPNREGWKLPDLTARELIALGAMAAIILWLGLWPKPLLRVTQAPLSSVDQTVYVALVKARERAAEQ